MLRARKKKANKTEKKLLVLKRIKVIKDQICTYKILKHVKPIHELPPPQNCHFTVVCNDDNNLLQNQEDVPQTSRNSQ